MTDRNFDPKSKTPRHHECICTERHFSGSVFIIMRPSEALVTHRAALRQLVSRHGLSRPRVFGSVLTGTDTDGSDLDLLVDPTDSTTLFTLAGLEHEAEELLGVHVSVLTPKFLSVKFRDRVLQQAEPL